MKRDEEGRPAAWNRLKLLLLLKKTKTMNSQQAALLLFFLSLLLFIHLLLRYLPPYPIDHLPHVVHLFLPVSLPAWSSTEGCRASDSSTQQQTKDPSSSKGLNRLLFFLFFFHHFFYSSLSEQSERFAAPASSKSDGRSSHCTLVSTITDRHLSLEVRGSPQLQEVKETLGCGE